MPFGPDCSILMLVFVFGSIHDFSLHQLHLISNLYVLSSYITSLVYLQFFEIEVDEGSQL